MKSQIYIRLLLLFVLFVIFGMTPGMAQGVQETTEGASINAITDLGSLLPWKVNMIDSANPVGQHVSVAIDRGKVFVSYYDNVNKDLRLARYVGTGGNCGPGNTWQCQIVDSIGDVGQYSSITTKWSELNTRVFISYYNATTGSLKYATGICNATCSLTPKTIDSGNPTSYYNKGKYSSVKYDSNGLAHISYYYQNALNKDALLYAHWVGDGLGNCGTGSDTNDWQCDTIHNAEKVGMYTSIDLDANDNPTIAYYNDTVDAPWVADYVGTGGNCGPGGNTWECYDVNQTPGWQTGEYISLAVEDDGTEHIAFFNRTNETLDYAKRIGAGGNCGANLDWQCDEIDDIGTSLNPKGISLAIHKDGYPVIAYQDTHEDLAPAALKVAVPGWAVGLVPGETNCGPQNPFFSWYCGLVDGGGSYVDEAGSASIAISSSGLATIAYHEADDYYLKGNLKIAFQQLQLFLPLISRE